VRGGGSRYSAPAATAVMAKLGGSAGTLSASPAHMSSTAIAADANNPRYGCRVSR
jgi:hypothetical protein